MTIHPAEGAPEAPSLKPPPEGESVFAVLMASGFSRRFGENKLLRPFRGKPLARYALELAAGLSAENLDNRRNGRDANLFRDVFFVYAEDETAFLAGDLPVKLVRNAAPSKGMRESVRLGVEAALKTLENGGFPYTDQSVYYLFLPCDQPFLDADTLGLILGARQSGRVVEPRFRGTPGGPSLFSGVFREELLSLREGEHPRDIKKRRPGAIIPVEVSNPLAMRDIDSPEDWETASGGVS